MKKSIFAMVVMLVLPLAFFACNGNGDGGDDEDTYTISGTVTLNDVGQNGVTVTLSGDASRITSTDSDGEYAFTGLSDGDYTVTPSQAGETFDPASIPVTISGADSTGNDFIVVPEDTYVISGQVTINGEGYGGVTVALTGDAADSDVTDTSGNYSFPGLADGSYTVTPTLAGQTFDPEDYAVTVSGANVTDRDFEIENYTISGTVTLGDEGYEGVTITLSGDSSFATTTDASGNYAFEGVLNGSYTVTPTLTGQTFDPADYAVTVSGADVADRDFEMNAYTISGTVTLGDEGYEGVTITLSGDADDTDTTDASGNYSFPVVNGSYTVTPTLAGQTFDPEDYAVTVSGANVTDRDFELNTFSISGQVTYDTTTDMEWVQVNLTGDADATTRTDADGEYAFEDLLNGSYTVTPVSGPQIFDPVSDAVTVDGADEPNIDFDVPSMIWLVDIDAAADTEDGYSWPTAFRHPQSGTDMAQAGEQVWVATGIYTSIGGMDETLPVLYLAPDAEYYGGFAAGDTALGDRDPVNNPTILDGNDFSEQIVIAADNAILSGFVVTGAVVPIEDVLPIDVKAPINANTAANFSLIDCVVTGNFAGTNNPSFFDAGASGMNIGDGGLVLNTEFSFNQGWNGPIYVLRENTGGVQIINSLFHNNNSQYGGGMVIGGTGPVRVINSTIANNNTSIPGNGFGSGLWIDQGVWLPDGDTEITNTIIYGMIDGISTSEDNYFDVPTLTYSRMESFAGTFYGTTYEDFWAGTDNTFGWPDFVDTVSLDYQLNPTSPCVDAGSNSAVPTAILNEYLGGQYDLNFDPRFVDTVDIGAYEFQAP